MTLCSAAPQSKHAVSSVEMFFVVFGATSRCGLWCAYLHVDERRWWPNESLRLCFFEEDAVLLEDF